MKSLFRKTSGHFAVSVLIAIFLVTGILCFALRSEIAAVAYPVVHRGNVLVKDGFLRIEGVGIKTASIGYVSGTAITIGAPGGPLPCVGLAAGAAEIGTTEGYIFSNDAADFTRFTWQLPDDWIDTGSAAELAFEFDVLEQRGGEDITIDVRFFEYGNTTAIYTDTITVVDTTPRGWATLDTNTLGSDADIGPGDTLIVEVTGTTDDMDFYLYGVRCKYRMGIQKVESES